MIPFEAIYQAVKGQSKIAVGKIKSFDYRSKKYLVKPTLAFLGVTALATSAAMYISGNQNISEEVPKKTEITKVVIQDVKPALQEKKIEVSSQLYKEFWCLKLIGWNEIRNGDEYAMKAVYSVVENRKNSGKYPNTYCKVMKQSSQFSFWNQGKHNVFSVEPKPQNEMEVAALKKIEEISMKVVTGTFNPVLPKNVLWYSTPAAKASKGSGHWTQQYKVVTQAGPHLFYTKAETKEI